MYMIEFTYSDIVNYLKSIPFKRYFLPLLGLNYLLSLNQNFNNYYILAIFTFFNCLIVFGNFTFLITLNNSKPLYYEDIYIDSDKLPLVPLDNKRKKVYKDYYTRILVFSNSLLVSALVCYWKSKTGSITSFIEIIGITGGLIEIAACFNSLTGKLALFLIKKIIKIQISSQSYEIEEGSIVEYESSNDNNESKNEEFVI